jgi:hypothetical protein
VAAASLADGPYTEVNAYRPDGSRSTISTRERQQYINELADYIANFTASGRGLFHDDSVWHEHGVDTPSHAGSVVCQGHRGAADDEYIGDDAPAG